MDWTVGDASGSETLTTSDHLYHSHINEFRRAFDTSIKTVATSASALKAHYTCDGNVDSQSTTTQTIINDAFASLSLAGGGKLIMRAGTYYVKTPGIKVPSYCTLELEAGVILVYAAGSAFTGLIRNSLASIGGSAIVDYDIKICGDGWLKGNSANAGGNPPRDMVWLQGVSGFLVQDLKLTDGSDSGIVLDVGCEWGEVTKCRIDTMDDIGIYCSDPNNTQVHHNQVRNTDSYGIRVIRRISNSSQNNQILSNRVDNCGQTNSVDGIIIDAADLTQVNDNTVTGSGRNGINLQAAYFTCSGNRVDMTDRYGIYVDGGTRGSLSGNAVHRSSRETANTYSGIGLKDASNVSVTGGRSGGDGVSPQPKYGVVEEGTSDHNVIAGVAVDRNQTAGVLAIGGNSVTSVNPT